jgi:hypothetical protein
MNRANGMRTHSETISAEWLIFRPAIDEDTQDVLHGTTTSKNSDIPAHAITRDPRWNYMEVAITGKAANDATTAKIYAARVGGDIALVWSGEVTVGAQAASDGGYWCDTYVSDGDFWYHSVNEADISGNDRMGRLMFDACGYEKFWILFDVFSSSESTDEEYTAYFSGL